MKTEELKALGLTDEQIAAVMKQNGQDVENVKAKHADYDDLKRQLGEAGKTIEELKGKAGDAAAIQAMADEWKDKAEQADKDAKAKVDALRFDYALERALAGAKARDARAVRPFLEMDKLKMEEGGPDGPGKISGLKEQLEKIKAEKGFLFEEEDGGRKIPQFSTGTGVKVEAASDSAARAAMGLPAKS